MIRYLVLSIAYLFFVTSPVIGQWGQGVAGDGPVVRKTLDLASFSGITLTLSGDVEITQGPVQKVEVESNQNIIDLIDTEVRGQHWTIKTTKSVRSVKTLKFYITIPTLDKVTLSGSGDIRTTGRFTGLGDVDLAISGSGDMSLSLEARHIEARVSGSGDMRIEGRSGPIEVGVSGSGNVDAGSLKASEGEVRISGSGDVDVDVEGDLEVGISGSGDVRYGGSPRLDVRISGSGSVRKM